LIKTQPKKACETAAIDAKQAKNHFGMGDGVNKVQNGEKNPAIRLRERESGVPD